ncbi:hypothetical protein A8713_14535 [Streptomyces sp. SAT1]|uniref:hypothetical protein n=1 Tax=unclassified Streptomyces TaxID=2593676 RepID=UPI0007DCD539|nr:hypothetical protein [Streptomyces sp. SAT1]ANH92233.1 hypothetical protein A8713_14535 [Streptomyces sp. SAT1]
MSLGDEHGHGDSARADSDPYGGGQTRTRLPDRAGDPYGGARRGARSSSRGVVTVVAVVVLLIAAIAFANRGSGSSGSASRGGSGARAEAAATAPTGTRPVTTRTAGLPSGFAHDQQGAQSAAANYAVTLGSTGMFKKDSRHSIVNLLYTPEAAAKLQDPLDHAYSADFLARMGLDANGNSPAGSTFVSRVTPVGTTVRQYSATDARISVWYVGLIGMSKAATTDPITSSWKTWTFDLRWNQNDWKIVSDTQQNGPAPVPGDDKAATSDQIRKAIEEYGGFTYAR